MSSPLNMEGDVSTIFRNALTDEVRENAVELAKAIVQSGISGNAVILKDLQERFLGPKPEQMLGLELSENLNLKRLTPEQYAQFRELIDIASGNR